MPAIFCGRNIRGKVHDVADHGRRAVVDGHLLCIEVVAGGAAIQGLRHPIVGRLLAQF